ncbi:MAG: helix-turn-helix transcriptional regulator, partial [Sphaerochaetaceae bacterium]
SLLTPLFDSPSLVYEGPEELPVLLVDGGRLAQSFSIICEYIQRESGSIRIQIQIAKEGLQICFISASPTWKASMGSQDPSLSLAQRIILMSHGSFSMQGNSVVIQLPWPSLSGESVPATLDTLFYIVADENEEIPTFLRSSFIACEHVSPASLQGQGLSKIEGGVIGWDANNQGRAFRHLRNLLAGHGTLSRSPMICLHAQEGQQSLCASLVANHHPISDGVVVIINGIPEELTKLLALEEDLVVHCDAASVGDVVANQPVHQVISSIFDPMLYREIRKGCDAPIVVIREQWEKEEAEQLSLIPRLLIAHQCVLDSSEFGEHLLALLDTKEVLPPLTGALVKRAVAYLGKYATSQISRWQLAESVNVSEDYLTRIFRKELGLSPWDYLNRQRVYLATRLLRESALSINEVASQTGFQDQAYFCRVFKKIKGCAPGKIRAQH